MAHIFHWILGCSEIVNCYLQTRTKKIKKKGVAHDSHTNQRPNVTDWNRVNRNMALRTITKQ